mgnify:CR=1 FL=1
MIHLEPNEELLMVIRRHWFALFRHLAMLFGLLIVPSLFFSVAGFYCGFPQQVQSLINFAFSLYILGLIVYAFIIWTNYYLDVWIITDKRLIDIEQRTLFSRTISELPMSKIQNVTLEIPGFIATILKFGNLKVETASQSTFIIREAPNVYKAKDLILKYAHAAANNKQPTKTTNN